MIKRIKNLFFFLIFLFISNCSFDNKTGIWDGSEEEKKRISEIEDEQKNVTDIVKVYSSEILYTDELHLNKTIVLTDSKKNFSWEMSGLNLQNFIGHIYSSGITNNFLKKKNRKR